MRVSPQPWLTEGDSVTLICEVTGSSTGWTFSWFRDDDRLSDSSRGAGDSYTLSPAALQHTGVYTCRAERGRPAYYTNYTQTLWITGESVSQRYYCVHLYLWFIKSLKQEAKTSETLKTCSYFPPVLSLYQLYQMHTHSICIRPFFKL